MAETLVEAVNIVKEFDGSRAVDSVSLQIHRGEALGLAGESGSGKSTLARIMLGLIPPTSGSVKYDNELVHSLGLYLRRKAQIVFQDPQTSLNPRMRVEEIISEPLVIHKMETKMKAEELLVLVKLPPSYVNRFPHELSGGERQRVGIARALSLKPEFLVLDEPISSLDVTIQVEILKLLTELKHQLGLTYLFIAHDLMVLKYICDRIAVMQKGKIVEIDNTYKLFHFPKEEYTQKLLFSIPKVPV